MGVLSFTCREVVTPKKSSGASFGQNASRNAVRPDCSAIYHMTISAEPHRVFRCDSNKWHLKCALCDLSFTPGDLEVKIQDAHM